MNIFENLEQLNVSEECFNDIMGIVEEILNFNPFEFARKFNKYSDAKQDYENQKAEDKRYKGSKSERIQKAKAESRHIKKEAKKKGELPESNPRYGVARREVPGENKDPKDVAYNRPRHSSDTSDEFPEYILYREDD